MGSATPVTEAPLSLHRNRASAASSATSTKRLLGWFFSSTSVMTLSPQSALDLIDKGSWLRMTSRDGELSMYKVAWLNGARSLALLVRFPDRRALSLRFDDVLKRLQEGNAAVMHMPEL